MQVQDFRMLSSNHSRGIRSNPWLGYGNVKTGGMTFLTLSTGYVRAEEDELPLEALVEACIHKTKAIPVHEEILEEVLHTPFYSFWQ